MRADGSRVEPAGLFDRLTAAVADYVIWGTAATLAAEVVLDIDAAPLGWLYAGYVLSALGYCLAFWAAWGATPGKRLIRAVIVDSETGRRPSLAQFGLRALAYALTLLSLGAGFFLAGADRRRRAWHDRIARTAVVHAPSPPPPPKTRGGEPSASDSSLTGRALPSEPDGERECKPRLGDSH